MKIVKLEEDMHKMAKGKAKELGMTLQGYLASLIKKDNKTLGVSRYSLDGVLLRNYPSVSSASLLMGIHKVDIITACEDPYKTAGGFEWKYDKHEEINNV